jgi:hypothetical protein
MQKDAVSRETVKASTSPAVSMLYKHALESIFKFLTLPELNGMLSVNWSWQAAVMSMKSLEREIELTRRDVLPISISRLARHITALDSSFFPDNVLDAEDLCILAQGLPHLQALQCDLRMSRGRTAFSFPKHLLQLSLKLLPVQVEAVTAADVTKMNAVIAAVSLLSRIRKIYFNIYHVLEPVSLAPLARTMSLRDLTFNPEASGISDEQIDQLRGMHQLERLDIRVSEAHRYARLLATPHNLLLKELAIWDYNDDCVVLLPLLPSLTKLRFSSLNFDSFDFLRGLPNVRSIIWNLRCCAPPVAALVDGLKLLLSVTEVRLQAAKLDGAQLTEALSGMSTLKILHLREFKHLQSLTVFSAVPSLAGSLEDLCLYDCKQLSISELQHIFKLKELQAFQLRDCFHDGLTQTILTSFTPPVAELPALKRFYHYTSPL